MTDATVRIYHNEHPDHWFGYEPGHPLRLVFTYPASAGGDPQSVADEAFVLFNVDPETLTGPALQTAASYRAVKLRSLSRGDVVRVDEVWLACTSAGWLVLDHEPLVS